MKLEIKKDCSLLLKPTEKFNFQIPSLNIIDFAESLVALMIEKNGFGLAANQVGFPYSIFAIRGEPENFVLINPRIVHHSTETNTDLEGCLSYPGLGVKQPRFNEVRVRFCAPDGKTYTKLFKGLSARVIQHEMDHLNGIPWWSGVSKLKFDIAVRNAHKRHWDYSKLTYKGI